MDAQMGGNIGTAMLALAPPAPERCHVIEMSSFQIELTPTLEPSVGILLNITPDHLDRHDTMEHYAALKARLVQGARRAIVGDDDDWCRDIAERLRLANRSWVDIVSARSRVGHGWYADGTELISPSALDRAARLVRRSCGPRPAARPPQHPERAGRQRRGLIVGVYAGEVASALATFPGLPHRLEEIGRIGAHALHQRQQGNQCRQRRHRARRLHRDDIYWIIGGKPEAGRHQLSLTRLFPSHRQGLSDRPGDGGVRRHAGGQGRLRALRHARRCRGRGRPRRCCQQRCRAPSCCCRRPVRPSISTAISRCSGDAFRALVAALPGIELRPPRR